MIRGKGARGELIAVALPSMDLTLAMCGHKLRHCLHLDGSWRSSHWMPRTLVPGPTKLPVGV